MMIEKVLGKSQKNIRGKIVLLQDNFLIEILNVFFLYMKFS